MARTHAERRLNPTALRVCVDRALTLLGCIRCGWTIVQVVYECNLEGNLMPESNMAEMNVLESATYTAKPA